VLNLGNQPLANSFKDLELQAQEEFPLAINRCDECYHVQLTHAVNPDLLFKNYLYVSGTSDTMREHFKWFADYTTEAFRHANRRAATDVFDIGCNDGSQLDQFKFKGLRTYGIDPATNLAPLAAKNHTVWNEYLNLDFFTKNPFKYDIITAQNVFAHNFDPVSFLQTIRNMMDEETLVFIQTSQADMIKNNEFDTIYHEHISFYNIQSMNELCKRMNLYLIDVSKCPLHGNSYIFTISMDKNKERPAHIENLIFMEGLTGLYFPETYVEYARKCHKVKDDLVRTINEYTQPPVHFWAIGYGAAAKGMTLLNFCGLKNLDFVIDDNPLKQGKFTPGTSIPIVSSEILENLKDPILFIPLAWNFFDEIRGKIKKKRDNKFDKFVKYFPNVKVID
jgi:SAM-dependent methyltransferase